MILGQPTRMQGGERIAQFHVTSKQASLYCSEECRKADALACCAFHDCDHPDESKHHDHLRFCHHHRPAIRIPSIPLLNLNPRPSAEQQAHGQHQADEWTRFLQQQYSTQYHSHSAHTSTLRSVSHDRDYIGTSQPRINHYHHTHYPETQQRHQQQQQQSFLLTDNLPGVMCQQQIALQQMQMHQQKLAFHTRQRRSSYQAVSQPAGDTVTSLSSTSLSQPDYVREMQRTDDCEHPCMIRKNKVLPPPTLSHIIPVSISNPALLGPTAAPSSIRGGGGGNENSSSSSSSSSTPLSPSSPVSPSLSSAPCNVADGEDQEKSLSHAWPQMDKFFFPDHCCRTSACNASSRKGNTNNAKKGGNNNSKKSSNNKKKFVSELPPPPMSPNTQRDAAGCIALSASIWGAGWRQVEPLPESFVKTIQKSNLLWAGCEKERRPHARSHQRNRRDSDNHGYQGQGCNDNGNGSCRGIKVQGHRKCMSDSSSWATECSSRLPRSLQFID
ncbi:hypothetical protein BGZ80_001985 [Entomortierella chlamydospora]|uniref:Uncharacterized protein n=1 Tax=Entomortierella chlamydospora TaxID=101097 RepID=A0A9P6MQ96_9FUNG|nr:hypothetical protein BGZ80_001985 [Entomortierella chlamydospora]